MTSIIAAAAFVLGFVLGSVRAWWWDADTYYQSGYDKGIEDVEEYYRRRQHAGFMPADFGVEILTGERGVRAL